jgi:hypothetical protein
MRSRFIPCQLATCSIVLACGERQVNQLQSLGIHVLWVQTSTIEEIIATLRQLAELQEDAFLRRAGIARFQRIVFLLHRLRCLLCFFRLWTPLRQLTQGGDDLFDGRSLHPEDVDPPQAMQQEYDALKARYASAPKKRVFLQFGSAPLFTWTPLRQLTQGGDDLFDGRSLHPEDVDPQRLQLVNLDHRRDHRHPASAGAVESTAGKSTAGSAGDAAGIRCAG